MAKAKFETILELSEIFVRFSDVKKENKPKFISILQKIENELRKEFLVAFKDVRISGMTIVCDKGKENEVKEVIKKILKKNGIEIIKGG